MIGSYFRAFFLVALAYVVARVHRLGQTRPVFVQRLVIADTVEDRVLAMQERKQTLADGSLGEGSGKKIGSEFSLIVHSGGEVLIIHTANARTLCQGTWYVFSIDALFLELKFSSQLACSALTTVDVSSRRTNSTNEQTK